MLKTKIFGGTILIFSFFMLITVTTVFAGPLDDGEFLYLAGGLLWDCPEVIEAHLLPPPAWAVEQVLPPQVNIAHLFPVPGNQGMQGSCVAWAVAYLHTKHEGVQRGWDFSTHEQILSPAYIFNQITSDGTGSHRSDALNLLVHQGVTTLASFPYCQFDFRTQPTVAQRTEAAEFRIGSWNTIRGVDFMRWHLANDIGVVVGVNIFPGFERISRANPVFDTVLPGERHRGGHAIVLVGYCDDKQAFKFLNSWGTAWGVDGFGWITYELMRDSRVSRGWGGEPDGHIMNIEDTRTHENFFDFTVQNGEATITRYFGPGGELAIPETIGGYPVTAIGARAIIYRARVGSSPTPSRVEIPDGVRSIGERAFSYGLIWRRDVISLTDVVIPESVTYIRNDAFFLQYFPARTAPQSILLPYLTIHGHENSFAQDYANQHEIPFAVLGGSGVAERAVTFHLGGGTRTGGGTLRQLVDYGGDAVPPNVRRDMYNFAGWDGEYTNVTNNRILRAQWTPTPTFTVIFDPAGGTRTSGGQLTQTVMQGDNAILPILTRPGYVFLGWDNEHTNTTHDKTITALWVHVYDARVVTFDLAGGTRIGGGALRQTIPYGTDAVPPLATRFSYVFENWDGDYTNVTTDRTITARWTESLYIFDLAFDPTIGSEVTVNGLTADARGLRERAATGEVVMLIVQFSGMPQACGWHRVDVTSESADIISLGSDWGEYEIPVEAGRRVPQGGPMPAFGFIFIMPDHDVTDLRITNTFTPLLTHHTVTFDPNAPNATGTMPPATINHGDSFTIPANAFTRESHIFAGWNTQADGNGTAYTPGATINVQTNITLYAQWVLTTPHTNVPDITAARMLMFAFFALAAALWGVVLHGKLRSKICRV